MKSSILSVGRFRTVLLVVAVVACAGAAHASFFDAFTDVSSYNNWYDWPGWQQITPEGTLLLNNSPVGSGCWPTSYFTSTYGTYSIKFRSNCAPGNFAYFGWFSRSPWGNPSVYVRLDSGYPVLNVGDGVNGDWNALIAPQVTADEWHVITLGWSPGAVSFVVDGSPIGTYTGPYVPTTAIPLITQTYRGSNTPLTFEVDYVSAVPEPSSLIALAGMTGVLGLVVRRRTR